MVPQRLVMPAPQHASASPDAQARSDPGQRASFPDSWDNVDDDMGVRRREVPLPQTPATPQGHAQAPAAPQPQRLFQTPQAGGLAPPPVFPIHTPAPAQHKADGARSRSHGRHPQADFRADPTPAAQSAGHGSAPAEEISMADIMRAITTGNAQHGQQLAEVVGTLRALDARTAQVERSTGLLEQRTSDVEKRIAALEARPQTPSSAPSTSAASSGGVRDPYFADQSIVRVTSRSAVSMDAVREALAALLRAAGIDQASTTLHGSQLGAKFTLRFGSATGDSTEAVQAVLLAKKDENGEWRRLTATSPTGVAVTLFVDRDKSYASRRTGWHLSRAAASLRESYPDKQFEMAR